jgi:hypothetical protein
MRRWLCVVATLRFRRHNLTGAFHGIYSTMHLPKHSFFYRNSLSLVVALLMLISLTGQYVTGWHVYNEDRLERGQAAIGAADYVRTGHFVSATFENWESEFLQMTLYVLFTIWLRQRGSSESKKLDGKEEVDRTPKPTPDAPWPVRKGGFILRLYQNSLSIALSVLFILSFVLHLAGSYASHREDALAKGKAPGDLIAYFGSSDFWFESFQNWQSEFLSVLSIVVLSIWLRQKGSPESKPVDAPYAETGK